MRLLKYTLSIKCYHSPGHRFQKLLKIKFDCLFLGRVQKCCYQSFDGNREFKQNYQDSPNLLPLWQAQAQSSLKCQDYKILMLLLPQEKSS